MLKIFKVLYEKFKFKIFKIRNPAGSRYYLSKDDFNIDCFKNIEWFFYGGSYYPYYILKSNGHIYYIPYMETTRDKNGNTIINKFLITKN